MPSRNVGHDVQTEILKAARRSQEVFGHAIKTSAARLPKPEQLAGNARDLASKLPTPEQLAGNARDLAAKLPKPEQVAGNARDLASKLPTPEQVADNVTSRLPKSEHLAGRVRSIAMRLPKPEQLAGNALDLAGKLLASQRKFADQVLRVTTLQLPGKRSADHNAAEDGQGSSQDTGPGDSDSQ